GPSVFPILFACVVGRAAHAILIWRLEKGARVGTLDLLAGSTSLTSTVTSQFQMRTISLLGLILIVIWALSPIGGQASFRQITVGPKVKIETTNFTYMIHGGNMDQYDGSDRSSTFGIINSLFVSSLISPLPARQSAVDTWGNVKIPLIESYEHGSIPDSQGWFATHQSNITYSSLVGLPISGFGGDFIRHSWWNSPTNMTSNCSITTTYVEVDIACGASSTCAVSRLRRSQLTHPPAAFTLIDISLHGWDMFANYFVNAMTGHETYPTAAQYYLVDPANPLDAYPDPDFSTADHPTNDVYAARLGQLVNTYWTCINGMHAIPGGMTPKTAYMKGTETSSSIRYLANSSTSVGTRSTSTPVIQCNYAWVSVLSVASIILVIASLVRPVAAFFFTTAPDLMLNISSLAMRDNPYIAQAASGTFLVASDRARLLKKMKVRFGDVDGTNEVGSLAIASLDPSGVTNVESVRKLRLYW
ncbi:hypothetical protein M434DRAFT_82742, partial [Hypoxylon sp. CO27-5]